MYSKIFANTTMDTTTLIAYVVNCSVCFTIGLMFLLTPAQKDIRRKDRIIQYGAYVPCRLFIP